LVEPVPIEEDGDAVHDAEFISSTPAVQEGSRIRRDAFSPNYFNTFFIEERELGRGGKGVVLLVRHEIDGCHLGHFACKRVPVGDDHAWLEKVLTEVELLARLSHPNLVSYRHVWLEDVKLTRFGPSVACAFILQQYCNGGDLLHYIVGDLPKATTKEELKAQMRRRSKGQQTERPEGLSPSQRCLPFEEIYSLFKDITSGLAYLHAANYIHRDLKPSNCLLHHEGRNMICLISDFGEVQAENNVRKSTGSTGTVSYCAPEVLKLDVTGRYGNFTTKSDIFSLGMILYFMCFGRLPYRSANAVQEELEDIDELRAEITDWKGFQDERRERPDLPSKLYQLLKRLLAVDPLERPSASEVLSAMKSESSLDGFARRGRSSSPSIGHRIQSLDSPMHPGTPVPGTSRCSHDVACTLTSLPLADPTKHARVTSTADEDLITVRDEHSLQKHSHPTSPRRRSHAMTPSLSHEGFTRARHQHPRSPTRGGSRSPVRNGTTTGANNNHILAPIPSFPHDRPVEEAEDRDPHPSSPTINTPLLMPPPSTFIGDVRHRAAVARHQAGSFARRNSENLAFLGKLAVFLAKMSALARVCWPYSADWGVGAGLVAIAALDLRVPPGSARAAGDGGREWRGVPGDGGAIVRGNTHGPDRDHNHGFEAEAVGAGGAINRVDAGAGATRRSWECGWGWQVSGMLLVLHFLVLWVTSRYGALCAAAHEQWAEW